MAAARRLGLVSVLLAIGCREAAPAPAGTGAREAALAFYQALVRQDCDAAHAALDADSRARVGRPRFTALASAYRRGLPFEPAVVQLTACDEQDDRAVAHVVLVGRPAAHQRFKDTTSLRRGPDGWGVVLAANFGAPRRR